MAELATALAPRLREYQPAPGRLNADTLEVMRRFAEQAAADDDVRQLAELWLRDHRVPSRNDRAELISLAELVAQRVPYRKDPVRRERIKHPRVALGVGPFKQWAFTGDDCEAIACAIAGVTGAMGHQPSRFTTGIGHCPHEQRGMRCPHPAALRAQMFAGMTNGPCPDSEAHVFEESWCERGMKEPGWLALDPVALPQPLGYRPRLYFERHYPAIGSPSRALASYSGSSMQPYNIANATDQPMTDPLIRYVLGRPASSSDIVTLGAELEEAAGYNMQQFEVGTVFAGDPGASLVFLGLGTCGGYYGDAGGGLWLEVPQDFAMGGLWSSIKSAASKVKGALGSGVKFFQKYAKPASAIAAFVPGLGTAVAAGIAAADKAAQLAMRTAAKAEDLQRAAAKVTNPAQAKALIRDAAQLDTRALAMLARAKQDVNKVAKYIPPGVGREIARVAPALAVVGPALKQAAAATPQQAQFVTQKLFNVQRDALRDFMRRAYGFGACPGGCDLVRMV